jgi:hypothetical protein
MPRGKKKTAEAPETETTEQAEAEVKEKKKRGPARRYSPEELRAKVEEFLDYSEKKNLPPLLPQMLLYLGIGRSTMNRWCDPKECDEAAKYAEVFEFAQLNREGYLLGRMVSDNKLAQGCLNALKQAENGGYTDRPVDTGENKVTINLVGVGGAAAAK